MKAIDLLSQLYPDKPKWIGALAHGFDVRKKELNAGTGASFKVIIDATNVNVLPWVEQAGNLRAMIHFMRGNGNNLRDILYRHDIPLRLLEETSVGKYILYNIRFTVPVDSQLDDKTCQPLFSGYFGITKRPFQQRVKEHASKASNNTGSLLHSVWHSLEQAGLDYCPVVQISGHANTLKEIYDMEEYAVASRTLTPNGLNAIPGGEAGIRMLHELALLKRKKVGIDERDYAVEQLHQNGHIKAHYRRGHMRNLQSGKLTYVRPCWVNFE